jgi:membrane dipeptidase
MNASRRKFLGNALSLATGFTVLPNAGFGACFEETPLVFDLHAHPAYFFAKGSDKYPGDDAFKKTVDAMVAARLSGAFFSLVADALIISVGANGVVPSRNFSAGEAWKDYKRQINILKDLLAQQPGASLNTTANQFQQTISSQKVAAYISCEGGDYLEGDAGKLEEMFTDGVRSVQLVHYHPNELGDLQTEAAQHKGLSEAGKRVVKRMNELGMVIDLAHASYETTKAAADISQHPIIISHTLLYNGSQLPIAKRMISKEHALVVSKNGGVIGAWPSGLNTDLNDFVDNIKRLVDAAGIDHVGIGTDMDANFKPVLKSYSQLTELIEKLKTKGFTAAEVNKLASANVHRILKQILKSV